MSDTTLLRPAPAKDHPEVRQRVVVSLEPRARRTDERSTVTVTTRKEGASLW